VWQALSTIDQKYVVEIFGALLTPTIAIITTYVAWQQWQIKKSEFNLACYDRRLAVYKALDSFYGEVATAATANYSAVLKLRVDTAEAPFLFGTEIEKHLNEVYQKGIRVASLHEQMYPSSGGPGLPVGQARSEAAEEEGQLVLSLQTVAKVESKKLFGKYLRLA
jgi:hypothetical protein